MHDFDILDQMMPEPEASSAIRPRHSTASIRCKAISHPCQRWQIEFLFTWIKQRLRIKVIFGESENTLKTQIWIIVSVYALVATIKRRLGLAASLYKIQQVLSITMYENTHKQHAFPATDRGNRHPARKPIESIQRTLGRYWTGLTKTYSSTGRAAN